VTAAAGHRRRAGIAATIGGLILALSPWTAFARPTPTIYPGGVPESPDSVVIDFAVNRSPSLLSLRAVGPLVAEPSGADSAALPRLAAGYATPAARSSPAIADPPGEGITFSGLKSVSVEVGKNRTASLEQTLDLTIRGRVAEDVEVAAMVSDRRLPFEPDGTSRELEDLDRLSLSIRSSRAEATMGDFFLDGLPGQFAHLSRHLEGVRGNARAGGARWNVAAANAKGEKRTVEFRGEEGRQGPYALASRSVSSDGAGVVAGSEVIWLDGARLKRGADDDYVIDYGAGTVTFTVRHPMTAQSRIAVDFEASASGYRRSLYAATTQGGKEGGGSWFASYLNEGDDSKHPLGAELTPGDRAALNELGDSASVALPSGVRYAGPGAGSYAWDVADPAQPHWVYLGPAHGDYEVDFAGVGPGRGEYADTVATDGSRFYRYRGQNLGSYVPGRAVAVPSTKKLLDLGGAVRVFGALALEGEVARSGFDENALSSRDDGNNNGTAARFAARLDPRRISVAGRGLGSLRAQTLIRSVGERFEPFDRIDVAFEGERWNQATSSTGEERQELSLQYDPVAPLALRGEVGHRVVSGGSRSMRRAASADLKAAITGTLHWEEARNAGNGDEGLRSLWGFNLSREKGIVMPRVTAREERIQGQSGDSVDARSSRELELGLKLAPVASVRFRGGYGIRDGQTVLVAGGPRTDERATSWDGGVSARAGTSLSIDGGFTRRRVASASGPQGTDLAQLAVLAGRPGAPVTTELRYDVTQLREPAQIRELRPVAAGGGSYDRFGNPSLAGGYELVATTGDPSTRSRAVVQWRLDTYPSRGEVRVGKKRPAWRGIGGSSFLRLETLSTLPLGRLEHAFDPGDYLASGTTLRGTLNARQTLEYVPPAGRSDMRAEAGFRRERVGEIEALRSRRDAWDAKLSVRHPLPLKLRAAATSAYDRSLQSVRRDDTGEELRSILRGRAFELEVSRELRRDWSVSILSRQRRDIDMTHGGTFDLWSVGPTARYVSGARLRIDGRTLWGWSAQQGGYAPPGLYLATPVGSRLDYDFLGECRVRDNVSLSLSWTGFKAPKRANYYTGRFELRGTF